MKQEGAVPVGCPFVHIWHTRPKFYVLYKLMTVASVPDVSVLYMSSEGRMDKWNQKETSNLLCL